MAGRRCLLPQREVVSRQARVGWGRTRGPKLYCFHLAQQTSQAGGTIEADMLIKKSSKPAGETRAAEKCINAYCGARRSTPSQVYQKYQVVCTHIMHSNNAGSGCTTGWGSSNRSRTPRPRNFARETRLPRRQTVGSRGLDTVLRIGTVLGRRGPGCVAFVLVLGSSSLLWVERSKGPETLGAHPPVDWPAKPSFLRKDKREVIAKTEGLPCQQKDTLASRLHVPQPVVPRLAAKAQQPHAA